MNHMNTKKITLVLAIIVIIGLVAWFSAVKRGQIRDQAEKNVKEQETQETLETNTGITVEVIPTDESEKEVPTIGAPNLDRNVNISKASPESRDKWQKTIEILKADSSNFSGWVDLGLFRSQIADYEGARQAWEYANALVPKNSVAYGNLGNLYTFYLKDYSKAESYYKKAIDNNPSQTYLYFQLFELYHDIMKDTAKTKEFLAESLKKFPGSVELQELAKSVE